MRCFKFTHIYEDLASLGIVAYQPNVIWTKFYEWRCKSYGCHFLFLQKTKPLTPDIMQKVLKSAIQLVLFCPHKYFHVKLQEKLTVGECYFE